MNILVVGNGFDLAHGLKTSYADFLHVINVFSDIEEIDLMNRPDLFWNEIKSDKIIREYVITKTRESSENSNSGLFLYHLSFAFLIQFLRKVSASKICSRSAGVQSEIISRSFSSTAREEATSL